MTGLSLNKVIAKLEFFHVDHEVIFDFAATVPLKVCSHRGDYDYPCLVWSDNDPAPTVGALLADLEAAKRCAFEGYKGGSYRYNGEEELRVDAYGRSSGTIITDLGFDSDAMTVVILTSRRGVEVTTI